MSPRPRPVRPSRFAGIGRARARIALVLLALLTAAALTAIGSPGPRPASVTGAAASAVPEGQTDLLLYQTIVELVRNGTPYYTAAAESQRLGGYPLHPFLAFRLPTLAVVQASLPPFAVQALLLALCAAVTAAWVVRLRDAGGPGTILAAAACVLVGLYVVTDPLQLVFHETWAGLLIALSLALRRPGRWQAAVAIGLCAMLIRETALLYAGVMAAAAWTEGERREALGWGAAIAVFALVLSAHAHAAALVTSPLDRVSPGWTGLQGFGFYARLVTISSGLDLLPQWLASIVLALALFGWVAWRDPAGLRAAATFAGYAAVISLFARSDNFYWALVTVPALFVGLVFAPAGLRDLVAAATDRRRITVRRVASGSPAA